MSHRVYCRANSTAEPIVSTVPVSKARFYLILNPLSPFSRCAI